MSANQSRNAAGRSGAAARRGAIWKLCTTRGAALLRGEAGPTATEYAVMIGLIVLFAISTIAGIGGSMQGIYDHINVFIPSN